MHNHLNIISFHNSSEPSYWQYQRLINQTVNVKKDVFFSDRHLSDVSIQLTLKKNDVNIDKYPIAIENSVKSVSDCSHILNEIIFLSKDVGSVFRHNRASTQLEETGPWNCTHINSSNSILLFVQHLVFYKIVSYSNLVLTRVL